MCSSDLIIINSLEVLLKEFQICHICGKGNINAEFINKKGYKQFEYVNDEQPHLFAMADIIVSRAGATTLFEVLALRKPSLLIPLSRKASRGDQILNAKSFEDQRFSKVLEEEKLNEESLIHNVRVLYHERNIFITAMKESAIGNGISEIIKVIEESASLKKEHKLWK